MKISTIPGETTKNLGRKSPIQGSQCPCNCWNGANARIQFGRITPIRTLTFTTV